MGKVLMVKTQNEMLRSIQLLNEMDSQLPTPIILNIKEFLENQEWGLAYEMLCEQIYEFELPISSELYENILSIGESMEMNPTIWLKLKSLISE